jgi:hypothetical protein
MMFEEHEIRWLDNHERERERVAVLPMGGCMSCTHIVHEVDPSTLFNQQACYLRYTVPRALHQGRVTLLQTGGGQEGMGCEVS